MGPCWLAQDAIHRRAMILIDGPSRLAPLNRRSCCTGLTPDLSVGPLTHFFIDKWCQLELAAEETTTCAIVSVNMGIFMRPTRNHLNIFRIKPPMVISRRSVDFRADSVSKEVSEVEH